MSRDKGYCVECGHKVTLDIDNMTHAHKDCLSGYGVQVPVQTGTGWFLFAQKYRGKFVPVGEHVHGRGKQIRFGGRFNNMQEARDYLPDLAKRMEVAKL